MKWWTWIVLVLVMGCQQPVTVTERSSLDLVPEKGTVGFVDTVPGPVEKPADYLKESCVMNGAGSGTCKFTNIGAAPASMCGRVVLLNWCGLTPCSSFEELKAAAVLMEKMAKMTVAEQAEQKKNLFAVDETGLICSGSVPPSTTVEISFVLTQARRFCIEPLVNIRELSAVKADWTLLCGFEFVSITE